MKKIIFCATLASLILSGCTSEKDKLKSFAKCSIAARQLEQPTAKRNIETKLKEYVIENHINGSAMQASFFVGEVREEMNLEGKRLDGQLYTLVKIYNSSECTKLHEQEPIKMPLMYYLLYFFS
jgi:hypothetical protein